MQVPGQPLNTLFGFQRIDLKPAESMELFFAMQPDTLRLVNEKVCVRACVCVCVCVCVGGGQLF